MNSRSLFMASLLCCHSRDDLFELIAAELRLAPCFPADTIVILELLLSYLEALLDDLLAII